MKLNLLFPLAFGLAIMPSAMAQQGDVPTKTPNQVTASTQAAIQSAVDQLNQALLRGDANETLKWLAPEFELGRHQYRVRDREWMRRALPLQFKRGHYTTATAKILDIEMKEGAAYVSERIDAEWAFADTTDGKNLLSGIHGSSDQEWVQTGQGWRVRRNDAMFEGLVILAAPDAPLRRQPPISPTLSAATIGLPVEEPKVVLERHAGSHDWSKISLAFSPNGKQLAFDYDSQTLRVASLNEGMVGDLPLMDSAVAISYAQDGSLWTKDSERRVRRWNKDANTVQQEWLVAPRNSNFGYRASVAPDGHTLAVLEGQEVQVWSSDQDKPALTFTSTLKDARDIQCSPDGRYLALWAYEGIEVRRAEDGALLHTIKGENWGGFLGDGKTMVTVKFDELHHLERRDESKNIVFFRSVDSGEVERKAPIPDVWSPQQEEMHQQKGTISFVGFFQMPLPVISPDGRLAASVYYDGSVGIWDTRTRRFTQVLRGFTRLHSSGTPNLMFSSDGRQLAENSGEGEIGVWDIKEEGAN